MELVCTIGHSNRTIEDFIALLRQNGVRCLLDIRTVPKSRHNPQFGQDQLSASLAEAGIEYRYLRGLGGLRRPLKDSPNAGWRNLSFRGYADYMQTEEFAANVETVVELGRSQCCALMCAEAGRTSLRLSPMSRACASPIRPRSRMRRGRRHRGHFFGGVSIWRAAIRRLDEVPIGHSTLTKEPL